MGYHVERHHCSIDWLERRLIHVHNMGLVVVVVVVAVVVVEHVVLVEVVECRYLELDVVAELVDELGSKFLIPRYIPVCDDDDENITKAKKKIHENF